MFKENEVPAPLTWRKVTSKAGKSLGKVGRCFVLDKCSFSYWCHLLYFSCCHNPPATAVWHNLIAELYLLCSSLCGFLWMVLFPNKPGKSVFQPLCQTLPLITIHINHIHLTEFGSLGGVLFRKIAFMREKKGTTFFSGTEPKREEMLKQRSWCFLLYPHRNLGRASYLRYTCIDPVS